METFKKLPDTSFVVLEFQSTFGGTAYMQEVIDDNGIAKHVRYNQHIDTASWDSKESKWTLEAHDLKTGEKKIFSGNFLWMCQGYYRHTKAYTPEWPGMSDYKGLLIHPQHWPTDLDYAGKEVIVIGSGATAATTWIHEIVRRKIAHDQPAFTKICIESPEQVKKDLIAGVAAHLPEGFHVEKNFTPSYRPWQQRVAFIPDGDLFKSFADGRSGKELKGDIIASATGFNLVMFGDIVFTVDGEVVDWHKTITYRSVFTRYDE
ncbi:FAD/NAD(P)-binding domain-containing protein [Gonapodya prolifera JEL478]|uniref:FAD/NAD(P)-binding domain-containing protein n=1 Tax=Gonapodya prolifera (strain JEL478) TaxID=1344416 RepID=A0A139A7G8_GONPJ|nr:FAD/NAD(P)-binding domain-containing protein [Gonapodya prolifera JEL478]|eukprot:KXS12313.1 FAD/NAD(P)-binding domain-containing protein [Gonapodya prolifera JEL478]